MRVEVMTVKFGRTINTGNYNSERYDAEITVLLEDGDHFNEVSKELAAMARAEVAGQIAYRKEMRKVDRYLAGRPGEESLSRAIKRIEENEILSERDKEIFIEEINGMLATMEPKKNHPQPRGNGYAM